MPRVRDGAQEDEEADTVSALYVNDNTPESFGAALRARRRAAGLTQMALERITGITQGTICGYETGARLGAPHPVYRYALRCALGLPEDADGGWWRTDY